jgi:hypothetical protein
MRDFYVRIGIREGAEDEKNSVHGGSAPLPRAEVVWKIKIYTQCVQFVFIHAANSGIQRNTKTRESY